MRRVVAYWPAPQKRRCWGTLECRWLQWERYLLLPRHGKLSIALSPPRFLSRATWPAGTVLPNASKNIANLRMPETIDITLLRDLWDDNTAPPVRVGVDHLALLRYRSNLLGADLRITN